MLGGVSEFVAIRDIFDVLLYGHLVVLCIFRIYKYYFNYFILDLDSSFRWNDRAWKCNLSLLNALESKLRNLIFVYN